MKRTVCLVSALAFLFILCLSVAATLVNDENATYWYGWVKDGTEIKEGEVKINDDGIVDNLTSGNWEIKAQDKQEKITETYMSPATVWTKDAAKQFDLVWEVNGGKAEIGFLHTVGEASEAEGLATVKRDGSDLKNYVSLYYSTDGKTWEVCNNIIFKTGYEKKLPVLISGMTGYDNVTTAVGDGTNAYDEDYFIASAVLPDNAKYVKYVYAARARSNNWDPCVRDARFTAAITDSSENSSDSSDIGTPDTSDSSAAFAVVGALALLGILVALKKRKL